MKKIALTLALLALPITNTLAADGKALYATCAACHQANGEGIPGAFPPLADSEWVNGPASNLIRIQLRGLQGPITVKGTLYNSVMPAQNAQSDEDIAAVLTYIRSSFGNKASAVTAEQVKEFRGEVGKPMLTEKDLENPTAVDDKPKEIKLKSGEVGEIEHKASPNMFIIVGALLWTGICCLFGFTGIGKGND